MKPGELAREPLLHFLALGAALFALNAWLPEERSGATAAASEIRIGEGEVAWLAETWTRQWQRPPSPDELRGLVADFVKEERLSREAREMRLDENDAVVRRRLAQKVEFLVKDTTRLAEPTDEVLLRLYEEERDRFRTPVRVSFEQVCFDPAKRGSDAAAAAAAEEALRQLAKAGAAPADDALGDARLLERAYSGLEAPAVAAIFGEEFARGVAALAPGTWSGPVASGYGLHLVRVGERTAAEPRAFADVRAKVLDLWRERSEQAAQDAYFASLAKKYPVIADESVRPLLEAPESGSGTKR